MQRRLMNRESYSPSGRLGIDFFLLSIPIACISALILAGAICFIWYAGFYFALGIAIIVATMLSAALALGVRVGRCRNRVVAGAYGALAGLLMYGGAYYVDMVASFGPDSLFRFDAVPTQIRFRIETDRWMRGPARFPLHEPPAIPLSNGVVLAAELMLVCGFTIGVSVRWAGRVYCEDGNHWAECYHLALPSGCCQHLAIALETGAWEACTPRLRNVEVHRGQPYCEAVLEFCPGSKEGVGWCAYLSVRESIGTARWSRGLRFLNLAPFQVRQCALHPDELALLREQLAGQNPEQSSESQSPAVL